MSRRRALDCAPPVEKLFVISQSPLRFRTAARAANRRTGKATRARAAMRWRMKLRRGADFRGCAGQMRDLPRVRCANALALAVHREQAHRGRLRAISAAPPTSVATTGTPAASASSCARLRPS